jgi:hypothetical protein
VSFEAGGGGAGGAEPGGGAEAGAAFSRQPGSAGGASGVVCEWGLAAGGLAAGEGLLCPRFLRTRFARGSFSSPADELMYKIH